MIPHPGTSQACGCLASEFEMGSGACNSTMVLSFWVLLSRTLYTIPSVLLLASRIISRGRTESIIEWVRKNGPKLQLGADK